jgi:hypothetical protein
MNAGKKGTSRRSPGQKKPYHPPKLMVHGDIRALTGVKRGRFADGTGKPRTRRSGSNA